jgi:exopolyphosphatase/guanosine-5'-triphosphate,3'-diphosphate pyrophosphatase
MGSVRYTAEFLRSDPPAPEELSALLSLVGLHLEDVRREHPEMAGEVTAVGVAGTITTVAAVEIGLIVYDPDVIHHFVLTRAAVEDVFRTLATETLADRVHNPGLPRERADVIVAGCAVLVGIMRYFGHDQLVLSEHDLLDGVLAADRWPS